jgi:hypothetical protein
VPEPWEWPWWENPLDGGPGAVDDGRFRLISGTVKTRSARAPSVGQNVAAEASLAGRDTMNSRPHVVQRKG